jgi:hypothetical protein
MYNCNHGSQLYSPYSVSAAVNPTRTLVDDGINPRHTHRAICRRRCHGRRCYGAGCSSLSRFARLRCGGLRPSRGLSILAISPIATRL